MYKVSQTVAYYVGGWERGKKEDEEYTSDSKRMLN
jgi:hypothetical protein